VDKFDAAHRSGWATAEVVFGIMLALGLALDWLCPFYFGWQADSAWRHLIGAPLLLLGGAMIIQAKGELERNDQPSEPGAPTQRVVTGGAFKYSRNPLYMGLVIAFIGLAAALDKPWLLILTPVAMLVTTRFLILPEERYLEAKFGDEYRRYKRKVRRWL